MNVLDILTLIDSRLCSDFSTATSVYFGVESSKLGQAVSGKWGGHGVDDGGRREGGRAASLWWAFAHPPRASQAAQRFPGCLCDLLGALVSQFVVLQVDILCSVLDSEEEGHLMCAFPTGYGKSLPMLLLGLHMPEGRSQNMKPCHYFAWKLTSNSSALTSVMTCFASHYRLHSHHCGAPSHHRSSVGSRMWAAWHPCHGWKSGKLEILQLKKVTANLPQISPKHFEASMASRPKLLVCSVEYLADPKVDVDHPICQFLNFSQVRNVILNTRFSPAGTRPIVCVDEAQVSCYYYFNVVIGS